MTEEKKEEEEWSPVPIIVGIATVLVVLGLLSWQVYSSFDNSGVEHLTNVINARDQSVMSEDYIQGWMDCISEYDWWRYGPTNATSQIMNNTL